MKDKPVLLPPELSAEERRRIRESAPPYGGVDLSPPPLTLPNAKGDSTNPTKRPASG